MTTAPNSAILDPVTNPVLTVAPQSKEDTTMSGATNKITALYCRLSQEDARLGESLSIENQKAILLEYAKKNHFPNPVFFVDDGYSGTNYDRPGFQSMLVEIEAGRVGIVITKDLSRLGRNSALTGLYTNFTFPQYGVRYIAINDNYDTIDPNSVNNDFAGIKNWFNEFYARDTSRKIRAVQKAKGERGVPLTVNVPYGYVKDPENLKHWLVDPEAAAIVKRIFSMCMEVAVLIYIGAVLLLLFGQGLPLEIDFIFGDAHGFAGLLLRGIVIQLGEKFQFAVLVPSRVWGRHAPTRSCPKGARIFKN